MNMNIDQGAISRGLIEDLHETIHKYDGTLYMSTVLGCLELVKQQLIFDAVDAEEDEDYE